MKDLIERQAAIDDLHGKDPSQVWDTADMEVWVNTLPPAQPQEIIRCGECKYQLKHFYPDRRRKDGGTYVYGCELTEGYSHVCLDDEFCSRAERRTDGEAVSE